MEVMGEIGVDDKRNSMTLETFFKTTFKIFISPNYRTQML